jgi:DNA transposition AAA+ family ATPase
MNPPTATPAALTSVHHNTNYNIAPDQFEKVIAGLNQTQQETLRFWYFVGKERGWSLTRLAKACGASSTTLSRVFRGDYGADLATLCAALAKARNNFAESVDNPAFIVTSLAKRFFRICDRTRALRTVTIIWGAMGIGKTTVAEEYKRLNNHGRTVYYRCAPGLTFVQFILQVAAAAGIASKKQTHLGLRDKLFTVLAAGNRLLIVDELHQIFLRRERNDTTAVLQCEFLREIYDRSNCGLVLMGTKALAKHLIDQKDTLAQLLDRGTMQIHLPDKPSAEDVKAFILNYGLPALDARQPEAAAIVSDILKVSGLRMLTLRLRDGAASAANAAEPYTWSHFIAAFKAISTLGTATRG